MSKTTILIVEDELLIALSLRKVLEGAGYVCISPAVNYETAVALAFERRPDIILMDIKLRGEKTGIDAARTDTVADPSRDNLCYRQRLAGGGIPGR